MSQLSLRAKLLLLATNLLVMILLVGGVAIYGEHQLSNRVSDLAEVQIPAVRNMTLVEMRRGRLKTLVLATQLSDLRNELNQVETKKEFIETTTAIKDSFETLERLPMNPKTKEAIMRAKPEVERYVTLAGDLINRGQGDRQITTEASGSFDEAFAELEKKLEGLGELIEKDTDLSRENSLKTARTLSLLSLGLVALGTIFGIGFSAWIIRDLLRVMESTVSRLETASRGLSESSLEASKSASELSEAASEQASSLHQTMVSAREISTIVAQNADSAGKVRGVVESNQSATESGVQSVNAMIHSISEIKETNDRILQRLEQSNKEFGNVVNIISEIGEKTKVINDIVFQTKLLSFNASVEAARAGEHGKGFAVVAEEVGNLAQMSGNAAKEITSMLSSSIQRVNDVVNSTTQQMDKLVEIGKDKISFGNLTAQQCKSALEKVKDNAKLISDMINEIASASKEEAQGVQEINTAISQLDKVTQQNSLIAQKSSLQAKNLKIEASKIDMEILSLIQFIRGKHSLNHHGEPDSSAFDRLSEKESPTSAA